MLSSFFGVARQSFLVMLTNRLRFYTGVVTYLIYVIVYAAIWKAVYQSPRSQASLTEFPTYQALFSYVAIGWLARSFLFNNIDRDLADLIASGEVISRCMRPVSLHLQMIATAVGESLFRLVCFSPIIGFCLYAFFGVSPPANGMAVLGFVASLTLAVFIFAETNYLVGLIAFRTESVQGIIRAKMFLVEILSGLLVPLSYFPGWLRSIAVWTPFPTMTSIPNRIYIGHVKGLEILEVLVVPFAWCVVLAIISATSTKVLTKHLNVA